MKFARLGSPGKRNPAPRNLQKSKILPAKRQFVPAKKFDLLQGKSGTAP
jgi:hypothetical protein